MFNRRTKNQTIHWLRELLEETQKKNKNLRERNRKLYIKVEAIKAHLEGSKSTNQKLRKEIHELKNPPSLVEPTLPSETAEEFANSIGL